MSHSRYDMKVSRVNHYPSFPSLSLSSVVACEFYPPQCLSHSANIGLVYSESSVGIVSAVKAKARAQRQLKGAQCDERD